MSITSYKSKHLLQFYEKNENNQNTINESQGESSSPTSESPRKRPYQFQLSLTSTRLPKLKEKSITKALVEMIYEDLQPLQIVENKGFIKYTHALNSEYKLPNRKTLSEKLLQDRHHEARTAVFNKLKSTDYLAVTTDMWSSDSNKCFLTITVHFIYDFKLCLQTLSTAEIKDIHSAINIANAIEIVFNEWVIANKVVTIVSNNATNMKKRYIRLLEKKEPLLHCPHAEFGSIR